jgi:saccharopine dehydrogenase-like NADP-dependent oxidoreductase
MNRITVLGAGLVGRAIALDLQNEDSIQVTSIDRSKDALAQMGPGVKTINADLSDVTSISLLIADADLVVCAVPGFMGFETLRSILEAGKNVVDISFFPENALDLDELAIDRDVIAVVDCGVAPGLCNVQAGYVDRLLDRTDSYICYVGGLPVVRKWPYEYRAVFSPIDVLQEYTRPARYVVQGELVVREALSDIELHDFPGVGTLESFNTDGLRSLIHTMDIPDMKEKTLRYPGHANLMRIFRESGFFDEREVEVGSERVRPIDLTSQLLFREWRLEGDEIDLTVMKVILEGSNGGKQLRYTYDLLDFRDTETGIHSMARTTGYTATLVVRLVLDGLFSRKGISPPERLGQTPLCYETLLKGYDERGISIKETITEL